MNSHHTAQIRKLTFSPKISLISALNHILTKAKVTVPGSWGKACQYWEGEEEPPVPLFHWVVAAVAVTGTAQQKHKSLRACVSHKSLTME